MLEGGLLVGGKDMRKIVKWNSWNNIMFFIKIFSLLSIYKRKKKYEKSIKKKQTKSNCFYYWFNIYSLKLITRKAFSTWTYLIIEFKFCSRIINNEKNNINQSSD